MCVGETTTRPRPHFLESGSKVDGWVERRRLFQCAATERLRDQRPCRTGNISLLTCCCANELACIVLLHWLCSRRIPHMFTNWKQAACKQTYGCLVVKMRQSNKSNVCSSYFITHLSLLYKLAGEKKKNYGNVIQMFGSRLCDDGAKSVGRLAYMNIFNLSITYSW